MLEAAIRTGTKMGYEVGRRRQIVSGLSPDRGGAIVVVGAETVVSGVLSSPTVQAAAKVAIAQATPMMRGARRLMGCTVEERVPSGRAPGPQRCVSKFSRSRTEQAIEPIPAVTAARRRRETWTSHQNFPVTANSW